MFLQGILRPVNWVPDVSDMRRRMRESDRETRQLIKRARQGDLPPADEDDQDGILGMCISSDGESLLFTADDDHGCRRVDLCDYVSNECGESVVGEEWRGGYVLGVIRNSSGEDVCYKVWAPDGEDAPDVGHIDFLQTNDVTWHEPYSRDYSVRIELLKSFGYRERKRRGVWCFENRSTGDRVVVW